MKYEQELERGEREREREQDREWEREEQINIYKKIKGREKK